MSKESLGSGAGPETWLSAKQLNEMLKATLVDASSPEIKLLRKRLTERGISASAEELVMWFQAHLETQTLLPHAPLEPHVPAPVPNASPGVAKTVVEAAPVASVEKGPAAAAIAANKRIGDTPLYFLTPVKDEPEATVEETLHSLLDQGVYVFGNRTAGRAVLRDGDGICFYHSGVGVVADAEIASGASQGPVSFVKHPDRYPWVFAVRNVRYYLDDPVVIDPVLRARLDSFKGKDPAGNWSWFVQGTGYVTAHDFGLLTRG